MRFTLCVYDFYMFYPQNSLGYFVQGQFHLLNTQTFLWRQGITLEVWLGFENFQIVTQGFLGCQFLEKYRIFHFGQFLMHQKISGYFATAEYVIPRHIVISRYVVLYGYKLFLTSYVGWKIRKNVKFWQILHFFHS